MKIVHIESGLGNQMLGYVEYLAIKKNHPNEECYIETIIYDIPEASEYICQWNGYELDRIFGIEVPNIKCLYSDDEWIQIIEYVKKSRFWEKSWDYPNVITNALSMFGGYKFDTICVSNDIKKEQSRFRKQLSGFFKTDIGYNIRRILMKLMSQKMMARTMQTERLFYKDDRDLLCGFTLLFKFRGNRIETLDDEIRKAFVFSDITDGKNIEVSEQIKNSNSVAIHVRRGDMVGGTKKYYSGGFFKRAVKLIKKEVDNPSFFVFSDPDSVIWAKNNLRMLGLTKDDSVKYVDWNKGDNSFRDMQLMSMCKHCVLTLSSFSWWSAYLIENKEKITISPEVNINTTHHC